jgi:hypothetical protein
MGLKAEKEAGAIWRYHGAASTSRPPRDHPQRHLLLGAGYACWTDTEEQVVWRQPLADADGFP